MTPPPMPSPDPREVAQRLIQRLGLLRHPEGGWYRETWRSAIPVAHPASGAERAACTCIHFLLEAGDFSAWHRVASDEVWLWQGGGALELHLLAPDTGEHRVVALGPDAELQAAVPAGWLQAARPAPGSAHALAGCVVAPGFDFADFKMPGREELLREYPRHARVVEEMTR